MRLFALLLSFLSLSLPALAAPVEALIEEAIFSAEAGNLPEGSRLELQLAAGSPGEAEQLLMLEHDLKRAAFAALLVGADGVQVTVRGRVFAMIDLPVPLRAMAPGSLLRPEDFEFRAFPAAALGRFAVTELQGLSGYEVRRLLPAGRVVQSQSLQAPRAASRGEKIELVFRDGALQLSAPARALEDAAEGETLRVQNLRSGKTVMAVALGNGRAEVFQ